MHKHKVLVSIRASYVFSNEGLSTSPEQWTTEALNTSGVPNTGHKWQFARLFDAV